MCDAIGYLVYKCQFENQFAANSNWRQGDDRFLAFNKVVVVELSSQNLVNNEMYLLFAK